MMTNRRVLSYVNAEPFCPFRINMVSGKTYQVRHPEMIAVGRTTIHVFSSMSDDEQEAKERDQELSLIMIESIEPLDSPVEQEQDLS